MLNQATPDRDLVARIAARDRTALAELRIRYGQTAYAVAYTVVADPEQAEAAVAEAFGQAWRRAEEHANGTASVTTNAGQGRRAGVASWISQLTREAAYRLRCS